MPGTNVNWPVPLQRLTPWYPGQMGVPGTDSERGLRLHSTGTIFYVDPNAVGVSDQRDGTNPDEPLATIAAAIAKCQAYRGDVIAVMANNSWQYTSGAGGYTLPIAETVTINVPGVRLVGISPSSSIGVVWEAQANNDVLITVTACDVLVEGFAFDYNSCTGVTAISAVWNGTTAFADNLTVRNCVFSGVKYGIVLDYVWYANIHDNEFHGDHALDYGIYIDPADQDAAYCAIHDNWFNNPQFAISLPGSDNCTIHANRIYNEVAAAYLVPAAATNEGIDLTGGNQNIVSDN